MKGTPLVHGSSFYILLPVELCPFWNGMVNESLFLSFFSLVQASTCQLYEKVCTLKGIEQGKVCLISF